MVVEEGIYFQFVPRGDMLKQRIDKVMWRVRELLTKEELKSG